MSFSDEQITRYSRHILLPEVGGKGQKKIAQAKVFVVGAGGLGSPVALYLAAAGVGTIGLIDSDVVDRSNLQRQVLHHTPDVGRSKVQSAKEKIFLLNPDVTVETYEDRFTASNAMDYIAPYDVVIDGVDTFPAKFLINDACYFAGKTPYPRRNPPVRGAGLLHCAQAIGLLSMHFQPSTAARARAQLPRGRHHRRRGRHHRDHSGHGSVKIDPWDR